MNEVEADYNRLRDAIDNLLEPYRRVHLLRAYATGTLIDAVVSEACDLFGPEQAPKFISEIVNSDLNERRASR